MPFRSSAAAALAGVVGLAAPARALDPKAALTQYTHETWTVRRGAPGAITALAQATEGYLWVGTATEGLLRFDGVRFAPVAELGELFGSAGYSVRTLLVAGDGTLYVGAGPGLAVFSGGTWRKVEGTSEVSGLAETGEGTVVFGQAFAGFGTLREGAAALDPAALGMSRKVAARSVSELWVGTTSGLYRVSGSALLRFGRSNGLGDDYVNDLRFDRDGRLWAATRGGLARVSDGRVQRLYTRGDGLSSDDVNVIFEDRAGTLWLGTSSGGLNRLSGERLDAFTRPQGLTSDNVTAIFEDREGSLWVGTENGLNRFKEGAFRPLGTPEGLGHDRATTLVEGPGGEVWAWTDGGGLARIRERRVDAVYTTRHGLATNYGGPLYLAKDGAVWVGHDRGVSRFKDGRARAYQAGELGQNYVSAIFEDEEGVVVAFANDLHRLGEGGLRPFTLRDGSPLPRGFLPQALRAEDGTVYLVRPDRLLALRRGVLETVWEEAGLELRALAAGGSGAFWLATSRGLVRLGAGAPVRIGPEQGLDENVLHAVEDRAGGLWLGTPRGVLKLGRAELQEMAAGRRPRVTPRTFGAADGMRSAEARAAAQPAGLAASDGTVWFPTVEGLVMVDPADLRANPLAPTVLVESVTVDDRPAGARDGLRVPAGTHRVEIAYNGLSLLAPERVRFRYRLVGFDADFLEVGDRRTAFYTNLAPGAYVFEVAAANNDGVWAAEPARLGFHVLPRWYETWWARLLGLGLAGFGAAGAMRARLAGLRARERELRRRVEESTEDLQRKIAEREQAQQELLQQNAERRRAEEEAARAAAEVSRAAEELRQRNEEMRLGQEALVRENEERRKAEELAGRERDLLRALMDNIPDLIFFKDAQGRYTRVNRAFVQVLGLPGFPAVLGRTDAELFAPDYAQRAIEAEIELVGSGKPLLAVEDRDERSGLWLLTTKVPLRDGLGRVTGLVGVAKDVTERKRAEAALEASLHAFLEVVSAAAAGDLTRRGTEGEDTLGRSARSVNRLVEAFADLLSEVREAALSVSSAASELLATAQQIAAGAESQRDQVNGTLAAVEEMTASMAQVSRSAIGSAKGVRDVLEQVEEGDRSVEASFDGMGRIDRAVEETAGRMGGLQTRTRQIAGILELIEEVASQTTLLSLNAAIEAAHAGEKGAGFAVVAEEMRLLADRAKRATDEVTGIVEGILEDAREVAAAMEEALREVARGREVADRARGALRKISFLVRESAGTSEDISRAAGEQAQAMASATQAMQAVADISVDTAAGSREAAETVRGLVDLSERLNTLLLRFRAGD